MSANIATGRRELGIHKLNMISGTDLSFKVTVRFVQLLLFVIEGLTSSGRPDFVLQPWYINLSIMGR